MEAGTDAGGTAVRGSRDHGRNPANGEACIMTLLPRGVKVHLAFGFIDMRKGIDGLAMLVQGVLRQDPFSGHLFVFRGRRANLIEIVFWDGTGCACSPSGLSRASSCGHRTWSRARRCL